MENRLGAGCGEISRTVHSIGAILFVIQKIVQLFNVRISLIFIGFAARLVREIEKRYKLDALGEGQVLEG